MSASEPQRSTKLDPLALSAERDATGLAPAAATVATGSRAIAPRLATAHPGMRRRVRDVLGLRFTSTHLLLSEQPGSPHPAAAGHSPRPPGHRDHPRHPRSLLAPRVTPAG